MYAHGLGSIVLCEAYAMTRDRGLLQPAQMALNYISYAQDPVGGGWRYQPKQPGDTSVFGWQFMALKSGHMALPGSQPGHGRNGRQVPRQRADQQRSQLRLHGARHRRRRPRRWGCSAGCTWAGSTITPRWSEACQWFDQQGPSKTDMYYNYYATQVMRHYERRTVGPLGQPMKRDH